MKIIFAGSGEFGLPTLQAMLERREDEIALVTSQPDRPAGRGRHLTPTPISKFALEQGLPLLRTDNINSETLPPADLMAVIAFGQKIAAQQVDHCRLSSINLHGSILPQFRGAAPINAAIISGQRVAGNSIIRLADRMDAGAVLGQSSLEIGELETAGELHDRLAVDGATLMLDVIRKLEHGQAIETPQDESRASKAPKMSRESAKIDWTGSAQRIAWQIRGMYPWPGCHITLTSETGAESSKVTLVRARPVAGSGNPGTVVGNTIAASDGLVEIVELQPEGKRPMPLSAFRNGHAWHDAMRAVSR